MLTHHRGICNGSQNIVKTSLDCTLSGVAMELDLHPPLKKVQRKRLLRTPVWERRNRMILDILARYAAEWVGDIPGLRHEIVWAPVLPKDQTCLIQDEIALVGACLHLRQTAMTSLGILDPESEVAQMKRRTPGRFANRPCPRIFRLRLCRE